VLSRFRCRFGRNSRLQERPRVDRRQNGRRNFGKPYVDEFQESVPGSSRIKFVNFACTGGSSG
jgi:hypothetical protein